MALHQIIRILRYLVIGLLVSCATYKPYTAKETSSIQIPNGELSHSLFVLSGFSKSEDGVEIHDQLRMELESVSTKSTLMILGNIGGANGFPDSSEIQKRYEYEKSLEPYMETMESFSGGLLVLPGANEWSHGRKNGMRSITNLQEYLNVRLKNEQVLFPADGCPGPVEVALSDETILLLIDTQWWFNTDKVVDLDDGMSGCEISGKGGFMVALNDAMRRNRDKRIILTGYHPIYSNGPSNGYYPIKKHFLPPVIGSIHALYKRIVGNPQDITNPDYKVFRDALVALLSQHPNAIYLSSKETSLQYFEKNGLHAISTGNLFEATPTKKGNEAQFTFGSKGFTRIDQYDNGDVWLRFFEVNNGVREVFGTKLYNWDSSSEPIETESVDFGEFTSARATTKLEKKRNKRGFSGLNYRKEWSAIIENIEVFNLAEEKGGLKPIKRGGGMQTRSLRLEDPSGKQWVLRSVEKFPENALPEVLRSTIVLDLLTDQVSASHPYGALVIPNMAESVGVYHANPRLVYVPDDPNLGIYREDFGNALYLFEERADDDYWKDDPSFGNPDDIVSTFKLIKKMKDDANDLPDESHVIRSRLFDVVIGDWDRHDDQWRWSRFKNEEKHGEEVDVYRPIPRDRDQAFFKGDGDLIKLASHKWGQPKFQGFHKKIRDVEGLGFNARFFDRYFMTESDWSVWEAEAKYIQKNLTDEVIESAIESWPEEIYELNGEIIIDKLKTRRDDLLLYARKMYEFLSNTVSIVATDKADSISVERLSNQQTKVTVFRVSKRKRELKEKYYQRVFDHSITKEIRIYGLGGKDGFSIKGHVKDGIRIRLIGGDGKDSFMDESLVAGLSKKTLIYDTKEKTTINGTKETRDLRSDKNPDINTYNREEFKYNVALPIVFLGFNPDDLLFFGGGISFVKHGFRADPHKSKQTFLVNTAPSTGSYNFSFLGEYIDAIGDWDYVFELNLSQPGFTEFFYGFGNGTRSVEELRESDRQFYRARYSQVHISPSIRKNWDNDQHSVSIGGTYQWLKLDSESNEINGTNRFIFEYAELQQSQGIEVLDVGRNYVGGFFSYSLNTKNNQVIPSSGVNFSLGGRYLFQVGDESRFNNGQLSSSVSSYFSLGRAGYVVYATRIGGAANVGEFEFYHAARLGGSENLRGYRRLQFAGEQALFFNNDLRIKLFNVRNKWVVGPFGINLISDFGRVWSDGLIGEVDLNELHIGMGTGVWLAPFNSVVINLDYTKSMNLAGEPGVVFLRFGFLY